MSKKHGRENDTVEVVDVPQKSEVALREETIQAFWEENDIFNKSIEKPGGGESKGDYVFYDGPPFATGLPHYGHIMASAVKDTIPRFWTMRGYRVRRKWGWDCHGLPLENLIEKELGLATKRDIEEFGIKNFNEKARSAVMRYADEWRRIIPRFGRFVDMDDDYKTMDSTYTESVWWVFKTLHEKGLVYEGFKSMHLCPRCGTTLSNFEVNQGYKDIKDVAVTVKLPLLDDQDVPTDTSLLVWTTTPWTLPGNMAAAVHQDYVYVVVEVKTESGKEKLVLAKDRLSQLGEVEYQIIEEIKGEQLVGKSYQPPFPYFKDQDFANKAKAWQIHHADYVEIGEDGTGAVHLAPAYGEEDLELAKQEGIPIVHHVDEEGRFKDFVTDFAGQLVKPKADDEAGITHLESDIAIVKALKENDRLYKKENITHSYPHCWRCDTPLLNYATTSWFVEVTKFKDKLVAENQAVHWVPEYVGANRFGKWLEGARDWAVSRQRYWGAPLPVWKNPDTGDYKVIGSREELQTYVPRSGNTLMLMRHGEATSNVSGKISSDVNNDDPLTDKGRQQMQEVAKNLKDGGVDLVITSPFTRTKESADILKAELGLSDEQIIVDERVQEVQTGKSLEGKTWREYNDQFANWEDRFISRPEGQENRRDVQVRTGELLFKLEQKYKDKRIVIISHGGTLFALESALLGLSPEEAKNYKEEKGEFSNAEVRERTFVPYPHNDNYELDYHRPYIDQVELYDGEVKLERIEDVFDCWFESGSMPYGQLHYPFAVSEDDFLDKYYPAQFIAEGLDQTRGWFYSLIVLGTALFGKSPYQNVIVNGMALAEDGKKMSKSLQNYPDPVELADRQGVDATRFYLLSSPIMRAEDLNFSEKEVAEIQRKNIGRLHNVLAMYEMYNDGEIKASRDSRQVLDVWILARLDMLIAEVTKGYENYELDKAARPIADFIDDLSVWYVRRSRDRFKMLSGVGEEIDDSALEADQVNALATTRFVLRELSKVLAPVMPFYAEYLYQKVYQTDDPESVHLSAWPSSENADKTSLSTMEQVRELVSSALEERTKAGIKIRQPLQSVTFNTDQFDDAYEAIIKDELNVKEVLYDQNQAELVHIDTTISEELKNEGAVRELVRAVQGARAKADLVPEDKIKLMISTNQEGEDLLKTDIYNNYLKRTVGADEAVFADVSNGVEVSTDSHSFIFELVKK